MCHLQSTGIAVNRRWSAVFAIITEDSALQQSQDDTIKCKKGEGCTVHFLTDTCMYNEILQFDSFQDNK